MPPERKAASQDLNTTCSYSRTAGWQHRRRSCTRTGRMSDIRRSRLS